jgi:CRP-like cAMP-binding protein
MDNPFDILNDFLLNHVNLTPSELNEFEKKCTIKKFKKGEIIVKMNKPNNFLYFLIKGIVRNFIITPEGKEQTYNFRIEKMTFAAYSHYNNDIAILNTQCLEDCEMIIIPISFVNEVVENIKNGDRLGRYLAERHTIELVNFIIDLDIKSAIVRYEELENKYPGINQRVPQLLIASFLRITPEYLSKIKKLRIKRDNTSQLDN